MGICTCTFMGRQTVPENKVFGLLRELALMLPPVCPVSRSEQLPFLGSFHNLRSKREAHMSLTIPSAPSLTANAADCAPCIRSDDMNTPKHWKHVCKFTSCPTRCHHDASMRQLPYILSYSELLELGNLKFVRNNSLSQFGVAMEHNSIGDTVLWWICISCSPGGYVSCIPWHNTNENKHYWGLPGQHRGLQAKRMAKQACKTIAAKYLHPSLQNQLRRRYRSNSIRSIKKCLRSSRILIEDWGE